jgi:hypothetical protein
MGQRPSRADIGGIEAERVAPCRINSKSSTKDTRSSPEDALSAALASARQSVVDRIRQRWLSHSTIAADPGQAIVLRPTA